MDSNKYTIRVANTNNDKSEYGSTNNNDQNIVANEKDNIPIKGMGRNKKVQEEKRETSIKVYCTYTEKIKFENFCKEYGTTHSEYLGKSLRRAIKKQNKKEVKGDF